MTWTMGSIGFAHRKAKSLCIALLSVAWVATSALAASPPGASTTATQSRRLTLITGDRIHVDAAGKILSITPYEGRKTVQFMTHQAPAGAGGPMHTYIIPDDAAPLIGSGVLDSQLFNITELAASSFDDKSRDSLPLIATYDRGRHVALSASTFNANGVSIARSFTRSNAVALTAKKKDIGAFWQSWAKGNHAGVKKLWLDRMLKPVLDQSVPQISAPVAWAAGYEGDGITIAVIDSGVDATHPDLSGKVIENNFTEEAGSDIGGHGTHVAGIIAGTGAASGGKYRGVAPNARIVSAKVCEIGGCFTSAVLAGMEWAVAEQGARIVNMSIGGYDFEDIDPLEEAVNDLSAEYGALFVVAAGNDGPGAKTIGSPGTADAALAVGAVDRTDQIASFSGRGPRVDNALKPDITAPGVGIVSVRAAGTLIGNEVGPYYAAANGTSMAAPHVAGAAALLSQLHPDWTGQQLKSALMGSAKMNPALSVFDQGAGRVDVAAAFQSTIQAFPASLSLGIAMYPHEDDAPITRAVTYQNTGTTAATLQLSIVVLGSEGANAPTGMFTVSPTTLTLAPGATGTASFTANTQLGTKNGWYEGRLVATAANQKAITPFALLREVESYNVTLRNLDDNGQEHFLSTNYLVSLDRGDGDYNVMSPGMSRTRRVPAGRYVVHAWFFGDIDGIVLRPEYTVSSDVTITMDHRLTRRVQTVGPNATSRSAYRTVGYTIPTPFGGIGTESNKYSLAGWENNEDPSVDVALIGSAPADMASYFDVQWFDLADSSIPNLPVYAAAFIERGALLPKSEYRVDITRLATVHSSYNAPVSDSNPGYLIVAAKTPSIYGLSGPSWRASLPAKRTEYFYSNENTPWISSLYSGPDAIFLLETYPVVRYPNSELSKTWNDAPFGPAQVTAIRKGNELQLTAPLFGDRTGHKGIIEKTTHLDLYRNGVILSRVNSETDKVSVAPGLATYRLEAKANQSVMGLSSEVRGSWTFDSARVDDTTSVSLPLISARFLPQLNAQGQAVSGTDLMIPVWLEQFGAGGPAPPPVHVRALTVEASFDDGAKWVSAPVRRQGEAWIATVPSPASAQYVSLRAKIDAGDASSEQTIIRAYGLIAPVAKK